jgi:transposase
MFIRRKRSVQKSGEYEYLQIVESIRDGEKVRQKVIGTLGRTDKVLASGKIDALIRSLAQFAAHLNVVEASRTPDMQALSSREWGPALVFGSLWDKQGMPDLIRRLAEKRRFEFDVERASFAMALQRLCAPGSDLAGSQWISTVECPRFERLELQHFYRTTAFLAEVREEMEAELSWRDRDLFSLDLDLIFIDTTSLYVYTDSETELRKRGYSRDRRPDLPQYVLCVVVNRHGWPVAWDIFPGNTADCRALEMMVSRLRKRLHIHNVILVGDRGMISADTIKLLTGDKKAPFDYVLGCRMRKQKEVSEEVLSRAGRYEKVNENLEVKEVLVDEKRYVVCRNPVEARKDKAAREALLERLQRTISEKGPKAVIGNRGYARFVRIAKGSVTINQEAVEADARVDGKFVLTTNTKMPAHEVATTYKSLWRVERTFRDQKSTLEVRPIYHQRDDTSIGHIVASFLALRLEVDLQRRLDDKGVSVSWPDLIRDLGRVQSVLVELEGSRYQLRTTMRGAALHAFHAAKVRPPASITQLSSTS